MYMLGPDLLKLSPSAYTVAQELERYKMGVLKVRIDLIGWYMITDAPSFLTTWL